MSGQVVEFAGRRATLIVKLGEDSKLAWWLAAYMGKSIGLVNVGVEYKVWIKSGFTPESWCAQNGLSVEVLQLVEAAMS